MEWKPIETAPKDGSYILIINSIYQGEHPFTGDSFSDDLRLPRVARFVENNRSNWRYSDGMYDSMYEPTHWTPLPTPPHA